MTGAGTPTGRRRRLVGVPCPVRIGHRRHRIATGPCFLTRQPPDLSPLRRPATGDGELKPPQKVRTARHDAGAHSPNRYRTGYDRIALLGSRVGSRGHAGDERRTVPAEELAEWRRIRPDHVLKELVERRGFQDVSPLSGEDVRQQIALLCSAFLHDTLTHIEDKERYERLRLRKQRYLIHAKRAEAQGDAEDARKARAVAERIEFTTPNGRVERFMSITDQGTVVFMEGVDLRSPREKAMKNGPGERMFESQRRGLLVMKLSAVLVEDGMREPAVKKLAVPTILKALRSAYPRLLIGSFREAERRLSRYLRDRARICLTQGTPRDELLSLAQEISSKGPVFFSACPAWQAFINEGRSSRTKPPQGEAPIGLPPPGDTRAVAHARSRCKGQSNPQKMSRTQATK